MWWGLLLHVLFLLLAVIDLFCFVVFFPPESRWTDRSMENQRLISSGRMEDYLGGKQPVVLSLLASFLERAIQKNEKMLHIEGGGEETITAFHGLRPPSITVRQYIHRIFKYSSCSPSCFVVAHIYLDRYVQRTRLRCTSLNIHRLLITSLVVAAKFMDDLFFKNSYYARVGGISTAELNELELKFLFAIDFRLFVSVQTFMNYCSLLKSQEEEEAGRTKACISGRILRPAKAESAQSVSR